MTHYVHVIDNIKLVHYPIIEQWCLAQQHLSMGLVAFAGNTERVIKNMSLGKFFLSEKQQIFRPNLQGLHSRIKATILVNFTLRYYI